MKQSLHQSLHRHTTFANTLKASFATALLSIASLAGMVSAPSLSSTAAIVSLGAGMVVASDAMAGPKAIPGIGIRVRKNPTGNKRIKPTTTAADGSFKFTGLEPGNYEVTVGNNPPQMFVVGSDGVLEGKAVQDTTPRAVQTKAGAGSLDSVTQAGAEKGIKDQGVKGCGSCGLTGGKVKAGAGDMPPVEGDVENKVIKFKAGADLAK
jgi:SdrD B-like domain